MASSNRRRKSKVAATYMVTKRNKVENSLRIRSSENGCLGAVPTGSLWESFVGGYPFGKKSGGCAEKPRDPIATRFRPRRSGKRVYSHQSSFWQVLLHHVHDGALHTFHQQPKKDQTHVEKKVRVMEVPPQEATQEDGEQG